MKALALVALLALVGCGEVTEVPAEQHQVDAGPELAADGGASPLDSTRLTPHPDAGAGPEAAPVSCIASGCAACVQATAAGPGLPSAAGCEALIACVRAGGQGEYPWQTCANMHGASGAAGGLQCAQALDKACP